MRSRHSRSARSRPLSLPPRITAFPFGPRASSAEAARDCHNSFPIQKRLPEAASFDELRAVVLVEGVAAVALTVATPRQAGHETPQRGAVRREQPAVLVGERLGNTALVESPPVRRQPCKEIFDPRLEPAVFEKRDRGSPALAQIGGHQCHPNGLIPAVFPARRSYRCP